MSLKAYQVPKHTTEIYKIMMRDFTALKSSHDSNHPSFVETVASKQQKYMAEIYAILHFVLQSILPRTCTCMYLIGQHSAL